MAKKEHKSGGSAGKAKAAAAAAHSGPADRAGKTESAGPAHKTLKSAAAKRPEKTAKRPDYWGPALPERDGFAFSGVVIAIFTAVVILLVRMHPYQRPMDQFFWSSGKTDLVDFFSYYKMVFILICAALAILVLLYRFTTQTFRLQRSYAYWPMLAYAALVALSFVFSEYKEFAYLGYNDRFEGTLTLVAYMVMLFFVINTIAAERHIKWVIYPIAGSSALLSILGLSQALDRDFFRTTIGKKLITPEYYWENLDSLNFTFQNREIYQTVYNINYVSFYLTLLVPLFAMLFLAEKRMKVKVVWGILTGLLVFNLIGSASSGGLAGLGVAFIVAVVVLNRRLLAWKKPVLIVLAIVIAVAGATWERWVPEFSGAVNSVLGRTASVAEPVAEDAGPASVRPTIDYMVTNEDSIEVSLNGAPLTVRLSFYSDGRVEGMTLEDADGQPVAMRPTEEAGTYTIEDERFFPLATLSYAADKDQYYILLNTVDTQFAFALMEDGVFYANQLGRLVDLEKIPAIGWENNQRFGSNRGYIWSRTLPMMKETLLLGHGADTYCIVYPQHDYAGKYNVGYPLNIIVDKPHNMYMGAMLGTGGLSLLALLLLYGVYIVQSARLYFRLDYEETGFLAYAGSGIFFGIAGFLVAGLFNDSTVSVMPMFYGLLGTGIAINRMLFLRKAGSAAA